MTDQGMNFSISKRIKSDFDIKSSFWLNLFLIKSKYKEMEIQLFPAVFVAHLHPVTTMPV